MKRKGTRVRMADVAQAAQVSPATVSRLISGHALVSPETRERILKAALRLGFDLERGRKSRIIAFLLSNRGVLHPFHSAVLMGAEAYCAENDYGLLFLPLQYSSRVPAEQLYLPAILQRRQVVAGVIVAGTNSPNLLQFLSRRGIPWVVLGNNLVGEAREIEEGAVYFDDVGGAYELTRYLQSLGHREIAYAGNRQLPWFARRFRGYERAMQEAGLQVRIGEFNSQDEEQTGYLAARSLLNDRDPVTAIFAGDDSAARGAYRAARDIGVRVPEALSIAGFNDTYEAAALHPALTSVKVFTEEVGRQLAELLLKRINRPDVRVRSPLLPTQLMKRDSCAPAPRHTSAAAASSEFRGTGSAAGPRA